MYQKGSTSHTNSETMDKNVRTILFNQKNHNIIPDGTKEITYVNNNDLSFTNTNTGQTTNVAESIGEPCCGIVVHPSV